MDESRQSTERLVWLVAVVGFLVVGSVAWIGAGQYLQDLGSAPDRAEQLYLCVQAFTVQLPFDPVGPGYPPALQVARFLGPLVLAWAAIAALVALFRDTFDELVRVRWAGRGKGHTIVCGLGHVGGAALRRLLLVDAGRLVAVELDPATGDVAEARRAGVPVVLGEATDVRTWRRAGITRARRVLIACGNDQFNGEAAAAARRAAPGRDIQIAVHLADAELVHRHRARTASASEARVGTFDLYDQSAVRLLVHHPPFATAARGEPRIVVVGDDPLTDAIVARLGQLWATTHPLERGRLRVVLAAPEAGRLERRLARRYPDLDEFLDLSVPYDADLGAASAVQDLVDGNGATRVYVALRDEPAGLALALRFAEELGHLNPTARPTAVSAAPRNPVVVRTGRTAGLANLVIGDDWRVDQVVQTFSPLELTCDELSLFGDVEERLARMAHEAYQGLMRTYPDEARDPRDRSFQHWHELAPDLRESNRAQVAGMRRTFIAVGVPEEGIEALRTMTPTLPFDEDGLRVLAELEHVRWCAHKAASGVGFGPERTTTTHPDLRPWPELPAATQRKDREAVLGYIRGLAALGLCLPAPTGPGSGRTPDWRCAEGTVEPGS